MRRAFFLLALALVPTCVTSLATSARAAGLAILPAVGSDAAMPVYLAIPRGPGPFPAVLVLHGCEGFDAFYAYTVDKLAAQGYVGIAVDSVGPDAPYGACTDPTGSRTEAHAAGRALAWLRTRSDVAPTRLALLGYSMGGIAVLDLVARAKSSASALAGVRAAIAFYPNCGERTNPVAVPLVIFDGDADEIAPAAACAAFARAAKARGSTVNLTTYPGATHGFVIPGEREFFGKPIRFDRNATDASTAATTAFLEKYL